MTPTEKLVKLHHGLTEQGVDVIMRRSTSGVPHLVGSNSKRVRFSIGFMGKRNHWRIFWPYPGKFQTRRDFAVGTPASKIAEFLEVIEHAQ